MEKAEKSAEIATGHVGTRLDVVNCSIAELRLDPKNPRVHSPRQVRQIARSIDAFGFCDPVLIDRHRRVLAGHGRILACQELGWREVPTINLGHLTESQARAFMIADNRLTENSRWDERLLGEQLKQLAEVHLEFSLEATGFEVGEIDLLIEGVAPATDGADDPADLVPDPASAPSVSKAGDLWLLGLHRVYCGSALEESAYHALLEETKAAMVFTDPPYNVRIAGHASGLGRVIHRDFPMASGEMTEAEFTTFLTHAFTRLADSTIDGALIYVCIDWRHIGELLAAGRATFTELKNLCIWDKGTGGMGSFYRSQHELVFVYKSGTASHRNNIQLGQFGRYRTNVWHYPGVNSFARAKDEGNLLALHPTVKPVALVADAILDASNRSDVILDTFLGSGTTRIALPSAPAGTALGWSLIRVMWTPPFGAGRPGQASRPAMRYPVGCSMNLRLRKEGAMSDEMSAEQNSTGGSPVGYGKPPRHTRFKKGKSGNPTGRPKGTPNLATVLERALGEEVVVNEGGQRRTVSKLVATVTQLVNKATMGDSRATQQLLNVLHVLDDEPSKVNEETPTTESDAVVIANLIDRLGTMKGAAPDDPHI